MTNDEQKVLVDAMLSEIGTAQKYNTLVAELQAEVRWLKLTDEERGALKWGINWLFARFSMDDNPAAHRDIKTLRELFARLDVTKPLYVETRAEVSSHPASDRIYVSTQDSND